MVAAPIGSGLVTLWLSQAENVGLFWNSQAEFEVVGKFASTGILFYTGSFAILETGVMVMALAWHLHKKFEADRAKREQEFRQELRREWLVGMLKAVEGKFSEDDMERIIQAGAGDLSEEDLALIKERLREA